MAGLFPSFRSSVMPKRLLRYALARFDIFEDDALDLENLDLGFGLKNTVEFKDVGLKVDKLTKQLGLPAGYRIKKAKVSRLQITVPLGIYSGSIELTAVGVHISLEIASSENQPPPPSPKSDCHTASSPPSVPTAADLTQSFLETQTARDKRALEEALVAERQDLGASVSLSEDGSEEDLTYGTGQRLTLPDFLTDFLQGLVDRTRVTIRDVNFHLDIEVPTEPNNSATELISLRLSLDALDVQGVTAQNPEDDSIRIVSKEGKRHILLSDIRAYIVSEEDFFPTLARSPSATSAASKPPILLEPHSLSPSRRRPPPTKPAQDLLATTGVALDQSEPPVGDSAEAFPIPYDEIDLISYSKNDEFDRDPASSVSTPRASIYHDVTGQQTDTPSHSPAITNDSTTWPLALDRPSLESNIIASDDSLENSVSSAPASDSSGATPSEDLAQSHLFTHEEAESMYMSAFSQTEPQVPFGRSMPGSWDFGTEDAIPASAQSPSSGQTIPHSDPGETPGESIRHATIHATSTSTAPEAAALRLEPAVVLEEGATLKASEDIRASSAQDQDPPKFVKEILSVDSVSLHVPTRHKHVLVSKADEQAQLAESTMRTIPGAFSVHSTLPQNFGSNESHSQNPKPETQDGGTQVVEIHLGPVQVSLDLSASFMLATIVRRLMEAAKTSHDISSEVGGATAENAGSEVPDIRFSTENVCVSFLESVASATKVVTGEKSLAKASDAETLLRLGLERFQANMSHVGSSTETQMSIERFRLGYHDSDILSFDQEVQMRSSVRDTFPEAGADISLRVTQTKEANRCEVKTLPLRVLIDLQRLDETFSWFGGLSGFLQMSASVTSNTPQTKSVVKPAKPRGVRFDIPAKPEPTDATLDTKTDVRVGGLQLDLIGRKCGIRLRSTAVKVAGRQGLIGVGISKTQISGPHFDSTSAEPPVNIAISNARLEFLTSPREDDLDRLLALITPSKGQFEEEDDEIMVDTLLRQRRKGSVLKLTVDDVQAQVMELSCLDVLPSLGEELARLGTVAKYLPEDDRPGLLTLGLIQNLDASVDAGGRFGTINSHIGGLEIAHITFPTLAAFGVQSIKVDRNKIEDLIGTYGNIDAGVLSQSPVLMVRMIGDEMEPVIKIRMRNINFEYRVPTAMDILGLSSESTPQEFDAMLAASVANLGEMAHQALVRSEPPVRLPAGSNKTETTKPTVVNVAFRNCLVGLNPLGLTSKLAIILVDTHVEVGLPKGDDVNAVANLRKAAILLVDDVSILDSVRPTSLSRRRGSDAQRPMDVVSALCSKGYVNICQISSARATVQASTDDVGEKCVNVDLRDDLLVLETCADSFHTLTALAGALKPPTPPSKEIKYKTEVIPVQDLLASITADAFGKAEGDYDFDDDFAIAQDLGGGSGSLDGELVDPSSMEAKSQLHADKVAESIFDATSSSIISDQTATGDKDSSKTNAAAISQEFGVHSEIEVHENFFAAAPSSDGAAHHWNSARNRYDESGATKIHINPLNVRIRDVHVIWNLFDGYDWQHTRDAITKTVEEVESQAFERRTRSGRRSMEDPDLEDQDVVGDCLFNSIYVSIPANHDPRELVGGINHMLDETESLATTSVTTTTTRTGTGQFKSRAKKLRLGRSRRHKITFELQGVNIDLVKYPPGLGETDASIDVRLQNLDIFDHVPTSTWKKFATYDQDAGERELGTSMVHIEVLMVKPIPELAAAEFVLKATVLPLRLHVDQDALDFITRFFQFKDESQSPSPSPSDEAFIQRAEINSIPVVLDFKPKRVDYAGLRGGRTSEFMNFMILESARMTLRHTIVYGTTGWERLGNTLNDIWTPDVKRTQLAGVLAGVAPVRHLVNVGSGFRDLIEIPVKEYRKDGRIVRSLGKGAAAFARTTGTEIVKLGAKMAVGTQYVLQGAEGILTKDAGEGSSGDGDVPSIQSGWEEEEMEAEEKKQISLYADQPTGVIQGLRHAYSSLARDLNVTRDAIIAVPAEIMESQNAQGAARAVMRRAPTIIFRPAIGATRAVGQALMGATNALDPENLRRVENVSTCILMCLCDRRITDTLLEIQIRTWKIDNLKDGRTVPG